MIIDRHGDNIIKIIIPTAELKMQGVITSNDMLVQDKLKDYIESLINREGLIDFKGSGTVTVRVGMNDKNMILIAENREINETNFLDFLKDAFEPKSTSSESNIQREYSPVKADATFRFSTFDDLTNACKALPACYDSWVSKVSKTKLFSYEGYYYLLVDTSVYAPTQQTGLNNLIAILQEYGNSTAYSKHFLAEHGKTIMSKDAIRLLRRLAI